MALPDAFKQFSNIIKENEPLAAYTYMKVGGPADWLATAGSTEEMTGLLKAAATESIRSIVVGGGSNIVFSDAGYRGLAIINRTQGISVDGPRVTCSSGVTTNALVNQTITAGLSGLEVFLGIPGSVGGAIYNNSHYLHELIGNYIESVTLWSPGKGLVERSRDEMTFAYDYSILQETGEIVLSAVFELKPNQDVVLLRKTAQDALMRRKTTQPLSMPSSGCMFKNLTHMVGEIKFAGALIDSSGLKGLRVGGAMVSDVHANFIVNTGNATTKDVIDLSNAIVEKVKSIHNYTLEREVFIVNEFGERIDQ